MLKLKISRKSNDLLDFQEKRVQVCNDHENIQLHMI